MYDQDSQSDGLTASLQVAGVQPVPAQRAALLCSDGQTAINLTAVLVNVVIASLVLAHNAWVSSTPWYGIGGASRISVPPSDCMELGCAYSCSDKYVVAALESSLVLQTDPSVISSDCTCLSATLSVSGSTATGKFSDGTAVEATLSTDTNLVTIIAGGHCAGIYRVLGSSRHSTGDDSSNHDGAPYSESSTAA